MNHYDPLAGSSLRAPPANLRAEQALLGALMANNAALDRVAEFLHPHHFADAVHGAIFEAILQRVAAGRRADAISLKTVFENSPVLEPAGGVSYLAQLLASTVAIISVPEYGRAIRESWLLRELIAAGTDLVNAAFAPEGRNPAGLMEDHEARLLRIAEGAGEDTPLTSAAEAVRRALRAMEDARRRGDALAGVHTGFAALNRMTTGLIPGAIYVLGARPSMGKTGLGLAIAMRASALGHPTLFWSGEMSAAQLGARLSAAQAHLSTVSVFTARGFDLPDDVDRRLSRPLHAHELAELEASADAAERAGLMIDDRPAITVAALRTRARRLKRAGRLSLVVVDYLGLMRGSETARGRGRYEEITEISGALKALAMELHVPVLVLSQLNRQSELREDKRPTMADLRDSGAVEQDADVIMFLHRPHYYLSRQSAPARRGNESEEQFHNRASEWLRQKEQSVGLAEILVAKNRHGATGTTRLRFEDRTTWFRDEGDDPLGPAWPETLGG